MKKIKRFMFLETSYSLLIYLLLFNNNNTFYGIEPEFSKNNKNILKKLNNYVIIEYGKRKKSNNILLNKIFFILFHRNIKKEINNLNLNKYEKIYGLDHTLLGNFFIRNNFIGLEDGLKNYKLYTLNFKEKIKSFIFGRNPIMGLDKRIKKIYLTGLAPIPKEIEKKVEIINLKNLWNKKSEKEKKEILNIFSFSEEKIKKIREKSSILYTQPFSEDRILSEEEKIELYRKILENYDTDKIVIKKHPREKTNYRNFFPNVEILEHNFPAEIFNLLDIKFKKIITIFSTAALSKDRDIDTEIDFYGTEIHPKIFKKFGSMENIFKRNSYLSEEINE